MSNETSQTDTARPSWAAHEMVALILTVVLAVWVVAQWGAAVQPAIDLKVNEDRIKTLTDLQKEDADALNSFGVLDEENGVYRIPVSHAMEEVSAIYQSGSSFTNTVSDRMLTPLQLGKELFQTKVCFTCHQTDPAIPAPAGPPLGAPNFMGDFWGKEREVSSTVGGPTTTVIFNEAYVRDSIKNPGGKIVKGAVSPMPPLASPVTDSQVEALIIYIKSLSKKEGDE